MVFLPVYSKSLFEDSKNNHIFSLMKTNPKKYIEWMWQVYERNLDVDISQVEKEKIDKILLKTLPHIRISVNENFLKVGLNDEEFIISEINKKKKSLKLNGKKVSFNDRDGFKAYIAQVINALSERKHSKSVLDLIFPKAYGGFLSVLLLGAAAVGIGVVGLLTYTALSFTFADSKVKSLLKQCQKRDKTVHYKNSIFYRELSKSLEQEEFKTYYETIEKMPCTDFASHLKHEYARTSIELDRICKGLEALLSCKRDYQKESSTINESQLFQSPPRPKGPSGTAK